METGVDNTERKRTERLLDTQKQSLEMIVSGAPLTDVLTYLARVVEQLAEGRAVASILLLDEHGRLRNGASPSLPDDYLKAIDGLKADANVGTCSRAAALRTVVITPDIAADPKWHAIKHLPLGLGFQAAWSMPIMARDGSVLGTFGTYFRERREPETLERQAVEILSRTAALTIERTRAEERLKQSEERLRAIFEASRDGILIEDEERIVYVNKSYTHLFGYSDPEELIGRHVSVVISPEDMERLLEFGRSRARGELPASVYEFKGKSQDGTLIDVEASVSTSTVAGRAYITTMVRDIAERKQAQAALHQAQEELERRVTERTVELANTNQTLQAEIRERKQAEEARRHLLRQLVTAQEDERRRISRELHDQMGQHIAAIVLLVNSLTEVSQSDTATQIRVKQLEEVTSQLSQEVDTLAWELRPTALDDLGLNAALGNYVQKWSMRCGVRVDFHSMGLGDQRLPQPIETAVYRIAQEALTNILKYAHATFVGLILARRGDSLSVIVEDNGGGFDVETLLALPAGGRKMGLLGMEERTTLVGGTFHLESTIGAGTSIFVRIPLAHNENGGSCLE
ncbi:MAG: PAS domain S-box protein [Pyrinomonadaceae bacterium]|nr:PAS domain S-box protein [Pyrinomonadaceae bacterium]